MGAGTLGRGAFLVRVFRAPLGVECGDGRQGRRGKGCSKVRQLVSRQAGLELGSVALDAPVPAGGAGGGRGRARPGGQGSSPAVRTARGSSPGRLGRARAGLADCPPSPEAPSGPGEPNGLWPLHSPWRPAVDPFPSGTTGFAKVAQDSLVPAALAQPWRWHRLAAPKLCRRHPGGAGEMVGRARPRPLPGAPSWRGPRGGSRRPCRGGLSELLQRLRRAAPPTRAGRGSLREALLLPGCILAGGWWEPEGEAGGREGGRWRRRRRGRGGEAGQTARRDGVGSWGLGGQVSPPGPREGGAPRR